jgi:hypothetical protein
MTLPDPYSRTTSVEAGVLPVLIEAMEVRVAEPRQTAIGLSLQIPHPWPWSEQPWIQG